MSIGDSQHHGRTPASRPSLYKSHNLEESSRKESPCTAGAPRPVTFAHLGTLLLGSEEGLLSASMAQPGLDGTHSHPSPSITPHPYMVKVYNLFLVLPRLSIPAACHPQLTGFLYPSHSLWHPIRWYRYIKCACSHYQLLFFHRITLLEQQYLHTPAYPILFPCISQNALLRRLAGFLCRTCRRTGLQRNLCNPRSLLEDQAILCH